MRDFTPAELESLDVYIRTESFLNKPENKIYPGRTDLELGNKVIRDYYKFTDEDIKDFKEKYLKSNTGSGVLEQMKNNSINKINT